MDIFARLKQLDLPTNIAGHCFKVFEDELNCLYYPSVYIFPLTPEGEELYDYITHYHFENGKMVWESVYRYGAHAYNMEFEGEIYNVVLVNND